jgi:GntR family transcriptional regulator, transcriptional repressor for pyruvate dehydrogenase complex
MRRTGDRKPTRAVASQATPPLPAGAKAPRRMPPEKRHDAASDVIERITGMIKSGALAPGDKLHSEIRFAADLGISRSAVTKAYAKLEAYGLIRTVPQSGTYLAPIGSDALTVLLSNVLETKVVAVDAEDINALFRLRALVEELVAVALVATADEASLERLKHTATSVKKKILEQNGNIEDDLTFHMEIAELSGKPFFKSLLFFITLPMVQVYRNMEKQKRSSAVKARWHASMGEHDEIVAAICARDAERTKLAIRRHFDNSIDFGND